MRFPSLKTLAASTWNTVKRFPLALLFALAGTIAATIRIELAYINHIGENWCLRVMMVSNLGLLLSLSATLYAESQKLSAWNKFLLNFLAALVAVSLILALDPGIRQADYVRFILLSMGLHLLVAFAAFTKGYRIQGFWQFNKTLFLRFLTAVLYGVVLFAGLSAAIEATNYLFNFKFEGDTFVILFTWIVGIFSTTFFLGGVPDNFTALNKDSSYPKGLKVFTQYVLIPLATVYVLILLAYEGKIIIELNLPKGLVSYLILSYAVFGILSLLLVYPIRDREGNQWLKTYARSFYFLLIPLLGLLFVAVGQRVLSYGITEDRYFLMALAAWLFFITLYFLLSQKQNIKVIPVSLCIITLLSAYGPQSAFWVSMYSQRTILVDILQRNNACIAGKVLPVKTISQKDGNRAVDVLDYLVTHHDLISLQPYFDKDLKAVSDSLNTRKGNSERNFDVENYELRGKKLKWVKDYLNLNKFSGSGRSVYYDNTTDSTGQKSSNYYFHKQGDIDDIRSYEYLISAKGYNDTTAEIHNGLKFTESKASYSNYSLEINNERASFDLNGLAKKLISSKKRFEKVNATIGENEYLIPAETFKLTAETKHYVVTLLVDAIRVSTTKGAVTVTYADANYLVKRKEHITPVKTTYKKADSIPGDSIP